MLYVIIYIIIIISKFLLKLQKINLYLIFMIQFREKISGYMQWIEL